MQITAALLRKMLRADDIAHNDALNNIANGLNRITQTKRRLSEITTVRDKEIERHKTAMLSLDKELHDIRFKCNHEDHTHITDPAGAPGHNECNICGAILL